MSRLHTLIASTLLASATSATAQKWNYDFIVPTQGTFSAAIQAANNRPDKTRRFRIFVMSSHYRLHNAAPLKLTAPNTSIIGEWMQNTQVENCPQQEGIDITPTLWLSGADSTYIQDIELWSNFRNDARLYANAAVALRETNCKGNVLKQVSLLGTQNTYVTNDGGTTYLEDCRISGTRDFIHGGGTVFFNHCDITLANRGDASNTDIICAPTMQANDNNRAGYYFTSCYINGPEHQAGRYLLGRPAAGKPRVAFISTCMNIMPASQGWERNASIQPLQLAEFESLNATFELIDTAHRNCTVLTPEQVDAMDVQQVFAGWEPRWKSDQVPAPELTIQGRTITWQDTPEAGCYAVVRDRKIVGFTTSASYQVPAGTPEGSLFSIRCANQMGGLGQPSTPVQFSIRANRP